MTRRRRIVWVAAILVMVTLLVPAVAIAAPDPTSVTPGSNTALSWTNVRDSDGVPLSSYMFVTSDPSILNPLQTMLALVLQLLFMVWKVVVTLAIWVIGYALTFGWLNLFADVLLGTANLFAGQIATTIVLITAATLGAFVVSYFLMRGSYAKATMQVVTMLAVAVFGVIFLAHPLAEVLGPDGLLAKGRDLGISIAAGLLGNANPDPENLVATMQASLADHLARKPLQVWNFGHVIDDQCGSAWSSGMMSGDSNQVKSALRTCDSAAYAAADQVNWGQLQAGLVLFVCGIVLVWFAIKLGLRVIGTAMNAVYHGFMSIFGFAAGGYIYGPTQTFLIRNLVDTAFAAFGMTAYTIFLAIYVLVLGDVFQQVSGQVMEVFVVGAVVMVIASHQLNKLRASLESGGEWVANRFAMATQGGGGGAGGGGAPGTGIGSGGAPGLGSMAAMYYGLNTLNQAATAASNPYIASWAWPRSENPAVWPFNWMKHLAYGREFYASVAKDMLHRRGWKPGSDVDGRTLAGLVDQWRLNKLPLDHLASALRDVADVDADALNRAMNFANYTEEGLPGGAPVPAARAWVSGQNFLRNRDLHGADHPYTKAAFETAGVHARNFIHSIPKVSTGRLDKSQRDLIKIVLENWHSQEALLTATAGNGGADFWSKLSPDARNYLKTMMARPLARAHHKARLNPTAENLEQYRMLAQRLQIVNDVAQAQYKTGHPLR